ncbi:bifunctional isochorismate lyase/aryl carrier protein [Spinactinospora alkalitolerans]|uniref:Bifunctional isochorismate lyase/aryl carrier protein n=1 Tax=Spinactinospora alkalitolerans TaxID=687207 RepID=A0A852TU56_9ACTN|nr:phosphopantetheine-binding protein [Spinactinospora alkalitolerans]NYE46837.1 bifunctional isochorismate lyase/aryl carrier protein [Spinactinospora alkalitolerans]
MSETQKDEAAAVAGTADAGLTAARLHADAARVLGERPEDIDTEENLLDRGMDSIRLMSLVETWRKAGAETDFITLAEEPTVAAWTRLLLD